MVLGRRRSHEEGGKHVASNIPYVVLGTGMLWFGWFGFNAGSALSANETAAMAFATTHMASAAAMLGWIFFDVARGRRPSALGSCIGAVVGLVAITPAAGFVTIPHSIMIGFSASIISNLAVHWKSRSTLDDTLDVFPCHGVGGIVGMVLTGVLAREVGLFWGQTATFVAHMAALVIVSGYSFLGSMAIYKLTDLIIPLRVTEEEERVGLDLSQHGEFMELEPMRQFGYSE
jgi:Amt family ammonium transporter